MGSSSITDLVKFWNLFCFSFQEKRKAAKEKPSKKRQMNSFRRLTGQTGTPRDLFSGEKKSSKRKAKQKKAIKKAEAKTENLL